MFTWKKAGAAAFAGAIGVGMTLAGAGMAGATTLFDGLPGGTGTGQVVVTDSTAASVEVTDVNLTTGAVTGTITNHTGGVLDCIADAPGALGQPEPVSGVVTESGLVGQTIAYYQSNLLGGGGLLPEGLLSGSLTGGSLGGLLGLSNNPLPGLADQARLAGHLGIVDGDTSNGITSIADGATAEWSTTLSPRQDGQAREDFDAAAAFLCSSGDQLFIYAGDEEGNVPSDGGNGGGTGSLGSLGSLGELTGSLTGSSES